MVMMHTKIFREDSVESLAIIASLKVCAQQKDLQRGRKLHADIARRGLFEKNVFIGNSVVNFYAKCGALAKACEVFDGLRNRDVVSWNVLIAGYAQEGHGEEALTCFENMRVEGIHPNTATFFAILKACVCTGLVWQGKRIHAHAAQESWLERDVAVGNAIIHMYAECGSLSKAHVVFDKLPLRNVISWNVLIAGYVQFGHGEEALNFFEQMQLECVSPDSVTFLCTLKACGIIEASHVGLEIHAEIARNNKFATEIEVFNALLHMYCKCGMLSKAQEVFDMLGVRNVVTWNSLIAGYVHQGHSEEALKCFDLMQLAGFSPNALTFICALKACIGTGMADEGLKVHAHVVKGGLLESNNVVGTALIDMYTKCGAVRKAQEVFDRLLTPSRASWNALIAGYVQFGHNQKALDCFELMQQGSFFPDAITFLHILKACGNLGAATKGEEIHCEIAKACLQETDILVANALVDMYVNCGQLGKAREVFDKLPVKNVTSWNALIAGYTEHLHGEEVLQCFSGMQCKSISPDGVTFVYILKACANLQAPDRGQEIHTWIEGEDFSRDKVVGTALVDMYVNCGMLIEAEAVFEKSVRDEVSWNVLVAGFAYHSQGEKALKYFKQMQYEGFFPTATTFVSILKACASMCVANKGQEIHAEIARLGILEKDAAVVATALVDMYANCGMLAEAQEVFDKLVNRDGVLWAALIAAYAQVGKDAFALDLFSKMTEDGKEPDEVTFTIVLHACSHSGLVDTGQMYFEGMNTGYGIIPTLDHYTCMVDLFGRAGILDKSVAIITQMPFSVPVMVWHNLLGACQKHKNVEVGRVAFKHALQSDAEDALAFVSMRNIYVVAGRIEDADKIEASELKVGCMEDSETDSGL